MKKLFALIIIGIGLVGGVFFYNQPKDSSPASLLGVSTSQSSEENAQKSISPPTRLTIPSLQVDSAVEYVGLDKKGNMDVPKNDMNVAWYQLGYAPGEQVCL